MTFVKSEDNQVNTKSGTANVNGTKIYYEVQGSGPPVLFISGATGDADHFGFIAPFLADQFTIVRYDRRGNSRSPPPSGWKSTSMDEQADDAAGLIKALGLSPCVVFGTSGGGDILLSLFTRYPELLRGAVFHEPALLSTLPNPEQIMGPMQSMLEDAMAKGGPRFAMEKFLRRVAGDQMFERGRGTALQERMMGNAEVLFTIEMEQFANYKPDLRKLTGTHIPTIVAIGRESGSRPETAWLVETSKWLADKLGTQVQEFPGAHGGYFEQPEKFSEALRPFLQRLSQTQYVYAK